METIQVNEEKNSLGVTTEFPLPAQACCDEWKPQSKILSDYIMHAAIHAGWGDYLKRGGVQFRFCPWCGRQREPSHKV